MTTDHGLLEIRRRGRRSKSNASGASDNQETSVWNSRSRWGPHWRQIRGAAVRRRAWCASSRSKSENSNSKSSNKS